MYVEQHNLYVEPLNHYYLKRVSAFYPPLFTSIHLKASLGPTNMAATLTYCTNGLKQSMRRLCLYV